MEISLYQNQIDKYDELQHLRPDYVGAELALLDLATKYLMDKSNIVIADFCCGTGSNIKMLANEISINTAVLVDINENFINLAEKSNIKAKIIPIISDVLKADFTPYCVDAVVSMFAYHHVPDDRKIDYIKKVKETMKERGGLLFLGEIYMPNKEVTIEYYDHLYNSISKKSEALKNFLTQTAKSDDFEYKVSKDFADDQLKSAGFELLESRKIWPTDDTFGKDVGTFVEVWKLKYNIIYAIQKI